MIPPSPAPQRLGPGTHLLCTCGRSGHGLLCDGSHTGSGRRPRRIELSEPADWFHCRCGLTDDPPRCHPTDCPQTEPWFVAGPTAAGKSAVAAELAAAVGGEVVNADAFQLYRGFPILTAQPTPEQTALAPHHLFAVIDPDGRIDAAGYAAMAAPVIEAIRRRGRRPVIVGGSGLYLKALTHGLPPDLPADAGLRRRLADWTAGRRRDELLRRDPAAAGQVDLANDRYVTRALELVTLAGRPLAEARPPFPPPRPGIGAIVLQRETADLDRRITDRCRAMIDSGLAREVAATDPARVGPALAKAIGYRQTIDHIAGRIDEAEWLEQLRLATRRYAKRQRTWFRREPLFQPLPVAADDPTAAITSRAIALLHPPCQP